MQEKKIKNVCQLGLSENFANFTVNSKVLQLTVYLFQIFRKILC